MCILNQHRLCLFMKITFDTELSQMIKYEHNLLSRFVPEYLGLQIAFIHTNYQWDTDIILQCTFRQRNINLLLIILLKFKNFPIFITNILLQFPVLVELRLFKFLVKSLNFLISKQVPFLAIYSSSLIVNSARFCNS